MRKPRNTLTLPTALAVVILQGCTGTTTPDGGSSSSSGGTSSGGSSSSTMLADAGHRDGGPPDAGCQPFETYDALTGMCVPLA